MSFFAVAVIVCGVAVAFALGLATGFDAVGIVIFSFILLFAALGLLAVGRFRSGAVAPGTCPACGKPVSLNAPKCKHCGAPLKTD